MEYRREPGKFRGILRNHGLGNHVGVASRTRAGSAPHAGDHRREAIDLRTDQPGPYQSAANSAAQAAAAD
jgi:hypothetical protein